MRWGVDVSLWQNESELSAAQVNALAAGVSAVSLDVHIECDTLGSNTEYTK